MSARDGRDGGGRGRARRAWLGVFLAGCLVAGAGFLYKLHEFFWDVTSQEGFEFAGVHLVTYLLVAAGFGLLLLLAFLRGHFSDIERPKHELLQRECRHDLDEFA